MINKICIGHKHLLYNFLALNGNHEEPALEDKVRFKEIIKRVNLTELFQLALKSYVFFWHSLWKIFDVLSKETAFKLNHLSMSVVNGEIIPRER